MSSSTLEELKNFVEAGHPKIFVEFSRFEDTNKFLVWIAELIKSMPDKKVVVCCGIPMAYKILTDHEAKFYHPRYLSEDGPRGVPIDLVIDFEFLGEYKTAPKQHLIFLLNGWVGKDHMVVKIPEPNNFKKMLGTD